MDYKRAKNCRKCGQDYADKLKQCPKCGATVRGISLRAVAFVGAITGMVAIATLLVTVQQYFQPLTSTFRNIENEHSKLDTDNLDEGISPAGNSSKKGIQAAQPKQSSNENRTDVIVQRSVFLGPADAYAFEFNMPSENVTFLDGTITVEGRASVQADFVDSQDIIYCNNQSKCSFTVYGEQSGMKATDRYANVHLPINGGDLSKLKVKNMSSKDLQIVKVNFSVTYPISDEKTVDHQVMIPISKEKEGTEENQSSAADSSRPSLEELRNYALEKINNDRKKYNLPPLELSNNYAAQVYAEDILKTKQISYWLTNGEKPYMTYTKYGGTGSVAQNIALTGNQQRSSDCTSGLYQCETMDPFVEIESQENAMVSQDSSSNWQHRNNILDKRHTQVSIGISYDNYSFVMVQNFENDYIKFNEPIGENNEKAIRLSGQINPHYKLYGISIHYDELPTVSIYEKYKTESHYQIGEMIAGVVPPDGSHYQGIKSIVASNWQEKGNTMDIGFDLSLASSEKRGVYTIILWLQENKAGIHGRLGSEQFDATTYSLFVD